MAFRAAAMRVGAGASGAAVAGPSASHCYSRPAARNGTSGVRTEEPWVLPQFLDSNRVVFSDDEVDSTVNLFLGLPEGSKPAPAVVTELEGSDDESSESSGANFHMEEADRNVSPQHEMRNDFGRTLQSLLRNQQVQQACLTALQEDPAFHDMLARLPASAQQGALPGRSMELANLLPPAAQAAEVTAEPREGAALEDPFKEFLDGLAERAKGAGEKIKGTWNNMGKSVGQVIIRFGLAIHGLLGRPFQQAPEYPEQAEWARQSQEQPGWFQNPDAVGKVVIKVACVIVALMVFKRVVRV